MAAWVAPVVAGAFSTANTLLASRNGPRRLGRTDRYRNRLDARWGKQVDHRYFKKQVKHQYGQARKRGLTPQEFYGSPAAGGASSSGAGQVLGNANTAEETNARSIAADAKQRQYDRNNSLAQTILSGQAQIKAAEVSAEASKYGSDQSLSGTKYSSDQSLIAAQLSAGTQKAIADQNWKILDDRLQNVEKPKLRAELKISAAQLDKLTNDIATSDPKFVKYMKRLSMGVDNMLVEFLQNEHGIDVTDPESVMAKSPAERQEFLDRAVALSSKALKEASGIKTVGSDMKEYFTDIGKELHKKWQKWQNERAKPGNRPQGNHRDAYEKNKSYLKEKKRQDSWKAGHRNRAG